jgi:hypothetical protein
MIVQLNDFFIDNLYHYSTFFARDKHAVKIVPDEIIRRLHRSPRLNGSPQGKISRRVRRGTLKFNLVVPLHPQ